MTFNALIVITPMDTSWDDMEICIEFLPDWSRSVEITDQNEIVPLSMIVTEPISSELMLTWQHFIKNSCSKICENSTEV